MIICRLAMIHYLPKRYTTSTTVVKKLINARNDGINDVNCTHKYHHCDYSELQKIQYSYWIMPWNPMGSSSILFRFINWAFNKDNFN